MQSAIRRPVTNGDLDHAPRASVHTLDNGLQVVLLEDHSAPVVALQTWVRFGSADEDPVVAGIAHVFEHMLFKGTERFPNGEIAALIEGAGGTVNAWTNYDETVYHVTLSSRFWEIGFDVLSDAVLHSFFDPTELEREKEVVLEEFRRSKDNPDHEIAERLFDLTFTTHPYRRPIIGFEETVRPIQRNDMLRVFNTWYVPNNMIFVAVGDFDSDTMRRTVEDRFGAVPAAALPIRPRADEPAQAQPRVLAFPFRAELARVEIAMPSVEATDPQVPALDLLSDLLGSGYNSTLYTTLKRRRQLAHDVYAYNYTPCDRGVFLLGATCMTDDVAEVDVGAAGTQGQTPNYNMPPPPARAPGGRACGAPRAPPPRGRRGRRGFAPRGANPRCPFPSTTWRRRKRASSAISCMPAKRTRASPASWGATCWCTATQTTARTT